MTESKNKQNSIKIVLIGNSGVGKTLISQRYINGDNDIDLEPNSTAGASYFQKYVEIDGKSLSLDIWDTAGQEKYRSMGKMFYKDAHIVLFVYDITNLDSFKELKEIWFKELKSSGEKLAVFAVVGNKSDLYESEKVSEEEAREWAKEIDAVYGLVSAKTGDCINSLFENVVKKYLEPNFVAQVNKEIESRKKSKTICINNTKNIKNNEGGKPKNKCC